jgi:outer membrane receptor protein involved in Fe transport
MADDPPLKQVVAKTYDFGLRGQLTDTIKWNASVYHAMNHDDIQFIRASTSTSRGYYNNVGRTERQGLDFGISGQLEKFRWSTSYSYIDAKFGNDLELLSGSNSTASDVSGMNNRNLIYVKKGDSLPSIPEHQFKARLQYQVTPDWSIGSNLIAYSSQYMIGNENNEHQANSAKCSDGSGTGGLMNNHAACGSGKVSAYAIVNLDTQYNAGSGWKVFAKATNIFDRDYNVAGRLAETMFNPAGVYEHEIKSVGVIPGAPRSGWIGVRYEFGGAPEAK